MIAGIRGPTLKFVHDPTAHHAREKHHDLHRATRRRRGRHQQTGSQRREDAAGRRALPGARAHPRSIIPAGAGGKLVAPHFTDKARIADHIRTLPVAHTFVMLAFFYTNLLEYYVPRMEDDVLLLPIYLPEDFHAPFVDPLTATGPAVLEILTHPELYQGETLPLVGDIISPREMVETFQRVTGMRAEYRNAFTRDGLLRWFPEFASDELQVKELLGMVNYAVDHGYFRLGRDLEWSRRITPEALTWEQFLRATGWQGKRTAFNAS